VLRLGIGEMHVSTPHNRIRILWFIAFGVGTSVGQLTLTADEATDLFETEIRPLLVQKCSRCHGAKKQSGGLRVDSREALLKGGENGPALIRGDVAKSLVVKAIRRVGDLKMPPGKKNRLGEREIRAIEKWIELRAPWPKSVAKGPTSAPERRAPHWAFQRAGKPKIPAVKNPDWAGTPIDAFVLARLEKNKLSPSPMADRRTLIRRASYTLTGLPPTPEETDRFVRDADPTAYQRLVNRLLDSPQYGEQWARHWLDVARYSDTKGYVYAREERFWTHAWTYRDWVVRSLNDDLAYDRFLLLQLAADQVKPRKDSDLAAMGFLTLGRRFLGVQNLVIDDRIDVVTRGMMGLTVGCARCHDHKYDPIPTADYYSLHGVFASSAERLVCLDEASGDKAYRKGLQQRRNTLRTKLAAYREESSTRVRARVADYLHAQTELHKYPAEGFDQVIQRSDLLPAFVRQWEAYLREADRRRNPVFTAWHAYAQIPKESFSQKAAKVTQQHQQGSDKSRNPIVAAAFAEAPVSFDQVTKRYGEIFAEIDKQWKSALAEAKRDNRSPPTKLTDAAAEQLRRVLYGPDAPCQVPDLPIVHVEMFFDSARRTELWKLQGTLDRWIIRSKAETPFALTLVDRSVPVNPRILRRGNPINKGDEVPRQFLSLLAGKDRTPFQRGSGRLELAQAIIDPANPLTARVIVNRVWSHHFGQGLVSSPSDFGTRAKRPSHPELLDWLATRFVEEGWSLKKLHRWIMLSATFRQATTGPADPASRQFALKSDPDNRLLWRMRERRLTFEELRDSMLAASGELDRRVGGKPADLFKKPFPKRRTLYGLVDRQFLPSTLRVFDFASPDLHIAQRRETTVPQQALFFLNHPMVLERARALAKAGSSESGDRKRLRAMFRSVLQRDPTETEVLEALRLVHPTGDTDSSGKPRSVVEWKYGFGAMDEAAKRVTGFTPLPHFTGSAWRGGPKWPDRKLGWVQLTAAGGHPGNDRQHAAIRRWTAPRRMTIQLRSKLIHEAAAGDGIRAFIVSSRMGILRSTTIHQKSVELNVDSLAVEPGETIDFLVDIGEVLNSDQYLWEATISEATKANKKQSWNSKLNFPADMVNGLSPWEQLAHVLFCTNEFLFVE
jgi:hypothetical protein